ncbi:hypothetical protein C8R45DRAFT_1188984 [Mycena sanguinolenta]|nr:hypothetical protein C8R45DRAFT_1188984 [Mycena sanguinolenta]
MVSTRTKTYASVATKPRTSRKSFLQEAAEVGVSFNERNEPAIWASEALQSESDDEGENTVSMAPGPPRASSPTESGDESDVSSNDTTDMSFDSFSLIGESSRDSVDWDATEGGFIVPHRTVKKKYEWSAADPLNNEFKFFPSWFDLSLEEDQLGPIPEEWLMKEERDLQEAIALSLAEKQKQVSADSRVSSMAVIVELPEGSTNKAKGEGAGKGKGVGAGERSAGFAAYLRKMQQEAEEGSKANHKKTKKSKGSFMRTPSQLEFGNKLKLV